MPEPQPRALGGRELLADLVAGRGPSAAARRERLARLEDERLHLLGRDSQHLGDLLVAQGVELRQDERGALILRQALEVAQQVAQVLAVLDVGDEPVDRGLALALRVPVLGAAGAQHGQAAVACDREQPRAQLDRLPRADERAVRGEERVLNGVLGVLSLSQHVPAEREDRPVVALVDRVECGGVSGANARDEPVVATQAAQPRKRGRVGARVRDARGFHAGIIGRNAAIAISRPKSLNDSRERRGAAGSAAVGRTL
jgi:hypothetical protein